MQYNVCHPIISLQVQCDVVAREIEEQEGGVRRGLSKQRTMGVDDLPRGVLHPSQPQMDILPPQSLVNRLQCHGKFSPSFVFLFEIMLIVGNAKILPRILLLPFLVAMVTL